MQTRRIDRRQFVLGTAASLVGAVCAGTSTLEGAAAKGLVGSQLYGWGQYYSREGRKYWEHLNEILSALRDAGYHYAEGTLELQKPDENLRFAEQLKSRGLRPVSLYSGGRLHEDGSAQKAVELLVLAAAVAKQAGFSIINCNPDPIGREKSNAELHRQAESLGMIGRELGKMGMKLGVHNHTPEMVSQAREFHYNLRQTPAREVGFCYDVHWVFRGGLQPGPVLKEYGGRIVSWHLRQSRDGAWWEDLDEGDVDYKAIARVVQNKRLTPYYTVELAIEEGTKITRGVVQNHKRSRDFVRNVFGC